MSDIEMILGWEPAGFGAAAAMWRGAGKRLVDAAETVAGSIGAVAAEDLAGPIRDNGSVQVREHAGQLRRDAGSLARFADELDTAKEQLTAARDRLDHAIKTAETDNFIVDRGTGLVLSNGARAKSIANPGATAGALGYHRRHIADCVELALAADERAAGQLRAHFPAGRHLTTPGMPLGRVEALVGLGGTQSEEVTRVRDKWGYEAGVDVEVLATAPGTTAVAVGDVRTAAHVVTYVPGTSSTADDLSGQIERAKLLHGPDTAVVVFTYDAPPGLLDAASARFYEGAGSPLQSFQAGLAENPNAKLTVVGHSYGATLVAQATRGQGLHADQVVLAGSPGAGPGVDSAKDMRLNKRDGTAHDPRELGRRVVSVTSPDDPIKYVGALGAVHGADVTARGFGANRLDISDITDAKKRSSLSFSAKQGAHTDDYFSDPAFRERLEKMSATIPGSGPGAGVGAGAGVEPDPWERRGGVRER